MRVVNLTVHTEYTEGAGIVAGAKGSANTTTVHVGFLNWDGLSKYATTRNAKGENPTVITLGIDKLVDENTYEFLIPSTAMDEEGLMSVTFTGYEVVDGNEVSNVTNTATAYLRVLPSDFGVADDNSITPTLAQQFQSEIDLLTDAYQSLDDKVAEAAGYADNSADSATLSESWAIGGTGKREDEDITNSKYYAEQSDESAQDSASSATISESWAIGGTGEREGEDTNNSEYFSGVSEGHSVQSESWAVGGTGERAGEDSDNAKYYAELSDDILDDVRAYAQGVTFDVNFTSGELVYDALTYEFTINNTNGHLEWETE